MNLHEFQNDVSAWHGRAFPNATTLEQGLLMGEEVGELQRAILKRHTGIRGTRDDWLQEIRKEIGDVAIALAGVATLHGIELDDAVRDRFEVVRRRDPRGRR